MANRQHVISVDLRLLTSGFDSSLNYIQGRINNVFGNVNNQAANGFFGSGGAFSNAAWMIAFNWIERAGVAAFRAIGSEINRSIEYQNNLISMATSYKGLLNLSTKDAMNLSRESNLIFQRRNAALPFAQYRGQMQAAYGDDFLSTFYDQNNVKGSLERTADMIGRTTVLLGSISGVTNYQRTNFLSSFLNNDLKKITMLEVFRNSPQLQRVFQQQVDAVGGEKEFNKMDRNSRTLLLENIATLAVDDDIINAYKNSLGGIFSRIGQQLFGDLGIFSFTRDLVFNLPNTSILSSLTFFFKEVFATDGVFGLVLPAIQGFVDTILISAKFLLDRTSFIFMALNAFARVLQPLAPLIYAASSALTVFAAVGIANTIRSAVQGALISSGASMLGGRMGMAAMFGMGGDLVGLKMLATLGTGKLISPIGNLVVWLDRLADVGWIAISSGFMSAAGSIKAFGVSMWAIVANPVFLTAAGIVTTLALAGYTLWKYWEPLSMGFQGFWIGFRQGLPIIDQLGAALNEVGRALQPIADGFKNIANAMSPVLDGFAKFFNLQQEKGTETQRQQTIGVGQAIGGAFNVLLSSPIVNPFSGFFNPFSPKIENRANGNLDPLMNAINREKQAMGYGANLAIANTNELIANDTQIPSIAKAVVGSNQRQTVINNTFNISGGNSQEIAKQILEIMNNQWSQTVSDYA
ncbi:hypothetical protein [Nostoc phage N1]|nr:hypothetical protein [Nostoc phage N1]